MNQTASTLLQQLDMEVPTFDRLDRYYAGEQPLAFLSPEARGALGERLDRLTINIPRLLVDSIADRLRVTGFTVPAASTLWRATDLDQLSMVAHREALILGKSFATVWADGHGRPRVSIESPRHMAVVRDPASREIVAGLKRWRTQHTTEAVLFEADRITRLRAKTPSATTTGFDTVEVLDNPLGVVPVVCLRNSSRLLDDGQSEMTDVLSLTDALVKLCIDMMVASEFSARPRRWATGLALAEDETGEEVSPIAEGDRLMISEEPDTKFGQLPGTDLAGYQTAIGTILRQISAVTGLPQHTLGIGSDNPASADAIRASEASLTARAESRQATFGRSWEQVARLLVAVAEGVDPRSVDVAVKWADASTRSVAQEADAVTKLFQAGLLPASVALQRLGYTDDEITAIRTARRAEALDTAGVDLMEAI